MLDDAGGRVLRRERVPTEQRARLRAHRRDASAALVERLRAARARRCRAIGIGTPGALSSRTGLMKNSQHHVPERPRSARRSRAPPRPAACGSRTTPTASRSPRRGTGPGRGARVVFGVILGTGVGGGIVIDGRLWSGPAAHRRRVGASRHRSARARPATAASAAASRRCISGPALERRYRDARRRRRWRRTTIVARARAGEARAGAGARRRSSTPSAARSPT